MRSERLQRDFFARHVLEVARDLIGRRIVFARGRGVAAGRIVEVEAYRGLHDPASHAFRGPTARSAIMFGVPGRIYVYLSYGMHHCMNVVAEGEGHAAAVLIRALRPTDGLAGMRRRRGDVPHERLARGPGCVTRALGLDLRHNGIDLTRGPLWIEAGAPDFGGLRLASSPRVGIRKAAGRPWRYYLEGSPFVSPGGRAPRSPRRRAGVRASAPRRRSSLTLR